MKEPKKMLALLLSAFLLLSALAGCGAQPEATAEPATESAVEPAELVLKNGTIQTMVSEDDTAQAVAVRGGVFVYVGDDAGVDAYIGENTQIIDLVGRYVTPGFIDAHIHEPCNYLGQDDVLDLTEFGPNLEAYKVALTQFVADNPDFPIYELTSMDLKAFPDSNPTNDWLDEICSDKPVVVRDMSFHGSLFNTKALEICGITKDTPAPEGGSIFKDENGELTGYFSDCELGDALPSFKYDLDDYKEACLGFQAEANSYGITGINSGGANMEKALEMWAAMSDMENEGTLALRVNTNAYIVSPDAFEEQLAALNEAKENYESDWIKVHQVKEAIDGVPEAKTAYLLEPYAPEAGMDADYRGNPGCSQKTLNSMAASWNAAGYQVQIHAMGDAAVRMALDAFAYSNEVNGTGDYRNQITHVTLITPEDVTRMADMGIIANMQPLWFYYDPFFSPLEEQMFGTERFKTEYHIRTMEDAGIIMTGSNDSPVTADFAPLHAIEAGVTQCSPYDGEEGLAEFTRNADQGVTAYEALRWYTVNGAYVLCREDQLGTIEVGKLADMAVLGYNILTCEPEAISDTPVEYTISGGRIVYDASAA